MKPTAADELSDSSQSSDTTVRAAETIKGCLWLKVNGPDLWGFL